ncbi:hypothetical protein SAMN05421767_1233 [Granulicatella balaenopterae]|uniref:N-acetyltransferase domain-containing protein n=1 Tax=Granulicatella balaenopterae TaxID=137733 RepID=A0A1H9M0S6_9LACT|nr:GNAT family N-acetyltransferase [Granulicatella balaenopterae]SER17045.1 hypothetical protein SAMN05421767_1233 [Granulicatella balaenopterae]
MEFTQTTNSFIHRDQYGKIDAEINFELVNGDTIHVTHTFVSETLRGQGVARQLANQVNYYRHKKHYQLTSSCSYITKLIDSGEMK